MTELRPALRSYLWGAYVLAGMLVLVAGLELARPRVWAPASLLTPTLFALAAYLGERMTARIGGDHFHSMSTVLLVAAALVVPPPYPLLIALAVMLAADLLRPLPLYKRLYNIAHAVIVVGGANLAFAAVAPPLGRWTPAALPRDLPALALLGLVYAVLDVGDVQIVLALAHHQRIGATLRATTYKTLIPEAVAIGMGVLAAAAWVASPLTLPLSLLPILTVRKTFQAIAEAEGRAEALRRHSARLEVVLQAGQQFRLQQPRADLVRPLALAARSRSPPARRSGDRCRCVSAR